MFVRERESTCAVFAGVCGRTHAYNLCVRARALVRACMCVRVALCMRVCACVRACVCVRVCARALVRARACVRSCMALRVRACVRVGLDMCACVRVLLCGLMCVRNARMRVIHSTVLCLPFFHTQHSLTHSNIVRNLLSDTAHECMLTG